MRCSTALLLIAAKITAARYELSISSTSPYSLAVSQDDRTVVDSIEILSGIFNYTATSVSASDAGEIANNGGQIAAEFLSEIVARIQVNASSSYVGAEISNAEDALSYGVWEYPWYGKVANENITYEIKGIGEAEGVNWANARTFPSYFVQMFC